MKRNVWVGAVAAALALAGCAGQKQVVPQAPPPELVSQDLDVQQDLTSFNLDFKGALQSQAAATLDRAKWEMVVEGKVVKSGEEPLGIPLPAGEQVPFELKESSKYVSSPEELKTISEQGGSLLAALRGKLLVNQNGNLVEVPFARSREVRRPRLPSVRMQELDGARYSANEANIIFYLGVVNPNPFPLKVDELTYTVLINGKQVAEGTRARGDAINPAATGVFDVQVNVDEKSVGPEVKQLIKDLSIPWSVSGDLKGDLYSVPYTLDGVVKLNVSK